MGKMSTEQIEHAKRATDRAVDHIRVGDRVSRVRCCDEKSTFTFTHWEGSWMCGATVSDCHALHVYAVNGVPTSYRDDRK